MASIIDVVEENDTGWFKVTTTNNEYTVFLDEGLVTAARSSDGKSFWGKLGGRITRGETIQIYGGTRVVLISSPVTVIEIATTD